ncbi:hypothetical protein [Streptomyces sp. NPDC018045]|uniref:hypothetical protein n=1 Tax=Streptomyces sp. NPDC018045 TaxID=3365037 RepID=UPI0037AD93E9
MTDEPGRAPDRVINPELTPEEQQLLRHARPSQLRTGPYRESPAAEFLHTGGLGAVYVLPVAAGVLFLSLMTRSDGNPQALDKVVQWVIAVGFTGSGVAAAVVIGAAGFHASRAAARNAEARRIHSLRHQCVLPLDLNEEAKALLRRAQTAARTVTGSRVHARGFLDRQRNELVFPQQEWEIAESLHTYTRLVGEAPDEPADGTVARLLDARARTLHESRAGVERRIEAMERYARQVAEADTRLLAWEQVQALTDGSGDVLDLLARTARDDLAVAELDGLTAEAAAVANAFTASLESAKDAAVAALPQRGTAA